MRAFDSLIDESNWETKEEYGPYGSYYVHNWIGKDAPPLEEAATEYADLISYRTQYLAQHEIDIRTIAQLSTEKQQLFDKCIMLVDEKNELLDELAQLHAENTETREALKMAKRGIEWWVNTHPIEAEKCDYDAMKEIDAALAKYPEETK